MSTSEDLLMLRRIEGQNEAYASLRRAEIKKFLDNAFKAEKMQEEKNSEDEQENVKTL